MVTRYTLWDDFGTIDPAEHDVDAVGEWVLYDDYAALESRLTSIISGVQSELDDERKLRLYAESRIAELEKDAARWRYVADQHSVAWADEIDDAMSREA